MKKILLIALLAVAQVYMANAQSFSDIQSGKGKQIFTESIVRLYGRFIYVSSKYTDSYSAYSANIEIIKNHLGKGETRTKYVNPTLGDLLWVAPEVRKAGQAVNNGQPYIPSKHPWKDHAHGAGYLGWVQYYSNIIAKDNLLFSAGISAGDYIYGSRVNGTEQDPYGYYLAAGPALIASYVPAKWCWVDVYTNYDMSFVNAVKKDSTDPKYPKPHFLTIGADFNTNKKIFTGVRYNTMIDRGSMNDASSRLDIKLGFIL